MGDDYLREYNWLNSQASERKAKEAKKKAWAKFYKYYPHAYKSRFVAETVFDENYNASAEIVFKKIPGFTQSVFGSDKKYWSKEIKSALGINDGFPNQLTLVNGKASLPIPAVDFHETAPSLEKLLNNNNFKIYVTPDQYFSTKFREIFKETKLRHESAKECRQWLAGPKMSYWPQQLNFAVFCATVGCGVSREIFDKDHSALGLPPNVYNFYLFHVYFTIRRILFQMGGPQNISALPGDPAFDKNNNPYDVASYKRICAEFGVSPSSDFRFKRPANHGLGDVWIWSGGPVKGSVDYPGSWKFSDEGGSRSKGNLIYYIEPDDSALAQADWFCPNNSKGLTQAGLSRINQSIEAFVYCILGAQVNSLSSILGFWGKAKETQNEFLVLVEDAIKLPDLAESVHRFQLAVDKPKVRLNVAVALGAWLMPGNMEINRESVVGYNNNLKQAGPGMKPGINNDFNQDTKKSGPSAHGWWTIKN